MKATRLNQMVPCLTIVLVLAGCASVPLDTPKTASTAIRDTNHTTLVRKRDDWLVAQPGSNGFFPLTQGLDAFGARLVLIDAAEVSIDAQYFMMKPDNAGLVFSEELIAAADRGVRVRFLLDDIFTSVDDNWLYVLNQHPNIELRIFNPISRKGSETLNYIGHFSLANRRMHNKSFTVDNAVSVVGGRNIAAEYFQLETTGEFVDFDMLVAGPIVQEVAASFDTYWNHELEVPFEVLVANVDQQALQKAQDELATKMDDEGYSVYASAENSQVIQAWLNGELQPFFAEAQLIADNPQKLLEKVADDQKLLAASMRDTFNAAETEMIVFTPYFIPRKGGMELIRSLTDRGVRVVVVTNSLATNNHTSVHSAYSSYRKKLLKAGVELWEARVNAAEYTADDGTVELEKLTLHTKGVLIDRRKVFVGSLNFDPRSIDINTEVGLFIESAELAGMLTDIADQKIPEFAYRLELDDDGNITWHAVIDGQKVVETKEPQTSGWKRFQSWFLKIVPQDQL